MEVEGGRADGVGCGVCVSPVVPVRGGGNAFSLDGRLASESEEAEFCFRRRGRGQLPRSLGGPTFLPASSPLDDEQPPLPGPDGNADGNRGMIARNGEAGPRHPLRRPPWPRRQTRRWSGRTGRGGEHRGTPVHLWRRPRDRRRALGEGVGVPYPHGARTFVRDAENGSGEEQGGGRRRRRGRRGAPQGPQGPTQGTRQAARTPLHWTGDAGPAGPHPAAAAQKRGGCGGGSSSGSKLCFLGMRAERR